MKRIVGFLVLVLLIAACKENKKGKEFSLTGDIKNAIDEKVYLEQVFFGDRMPELIDSADIKGGKFSVKTTADEEGLYRINFPKTGVAYIFANDVTDLKATIDANDKKLSGAVFSSPANEALSQFMAQATQKRQDYINTTKILDSLSRQQGTDSLQKMYTQNLKNEDSAFYTLVKSTLNTTKSPVVAAIALTYTRGSDTAYLNKTLPELGKRFPGNSNIADMQHNFNVMLGNSTARASASSTPSVGSSAPDFTMDDVSGKPFSLSSLKGKYVLVDFWASWCGPCRRENPNVVAAYDKYKTKNFTILGVSLDDDRGAWLAAIKKDKLNWSQVSDLKGWENATVSLYKYNGIPYNVLLDPQGKIIATELRGSDLESKLEEVLK